MAHYQREGISFAVSFFLVSHTQKWCVHCVPCGPSASDAGCRGRSHFMAFLTVSYCAPIESMVVSIQNEWKS
jgi:hypothetical protein